MRKFIHTLLCISSLWLMTSCSNDITTPKPTAYLRFDFPTTSYSLCDTAILPFTFDYSDEAVLTFKRNLPRDKWIDIYYPHYRGVVFLSYRPLANGAESLKAQIDTSYRLLSKHFDYSSGVDEKQYTDRDRHVYATTYRLDGHNVASTYQFWVTDSAHHFLRGSLFMDCAPNNDSLAPILSHIQADLRHLLESLQWRD